MPPEFDTDFDPRHGELVDVSPLLRRIVCNNPSKYTFHGTGTYVIGHGDVAVVDPGPRDPDHVEALLRALGDETVRAILITHTHGDHSPAAAALHDATGAPVLGFGPHPEDAVGEDDEADETDDANNETDDAEDQEPAAAAHRLDTQLKSARKTTHSVAERADFGDYALIDTATGW